MIPGYGRETRPRVAAVFPHMSRKPLSGSCCQMSHRAIEFGLSPTFWLPPPSLWCRIACLPLLSCLLAERIYSLDKQFESANSGVSNEPEEQKRRWQKKMNEYRVNLSSPSHFVFWCFSFLFWSIDLPAWWKCVARSQPVTYVKPDSHGRRLSLSLPSVTLWKIQFSLAPV